MLSKVKGPTKLGIFGLEAKSLLPTGVAREHSSMASSADTWRHFARVLYLL
jgi:hypothetical protein